MEAHEYWVSPSVMLPPPTAEVFVCYRANKDSARVIRRAHCYFNQLGGRYWDIERVVLPVAQVDYWMFFPELPDEGE